MTASEIIWGTVGVITILLTFSFLIWLSYEFTMKEFRLKRYPSLENKNMIEKLDKEINRLHKNYCQLEREKDKLEEQKQEIERKLNDLFFEVKALQDMKFKIEDNAQHDYLYWSLDEEIKSCERAKIKQQFRRSYESKKKECETLHEVTIKVSDEESEEEE